MHLTVSFSEVAKPPRQLQQVYKDTVKFTCNVSQSLHYLHTNDLHDHHRLSIIYSRPHDMDLIVRTVSSSSATGYQYNQSQRWMIWTSPRSVARDAAGWPCNLYNINLGVLINDMYFYYYWMKCNISFIICFFSVIKSNYLLVFLYTGCTKTVIQIQILYLYSLYYTYILLVFQNFGNTV